MVENTKLMIVNMPSYLPDVIRLFVVVTTLHERWSGEHFRRPAQHQAADRCSREAEAGWWRPDPELKMREIDSYGHKCGSNTKKNKTPPLEFSTVSASVWYKQRQRVSREAPPNIGWTGLKI